MTREEMLRVAWHLTDVEVTVLNASSYDRDGTSWRTTKMRTAAYGLFKRGLLERHYQDRNRYRVNEFGEQVVLDRRWFNTQIERGWR